MTRSGRRGASAAKHRGTNPRAASIAHPKGKGHVTKMERFDEFTRLLGNAGASRRRTLRVLGNLLLGSALGGSAVRLGLREVTEAEANYHKAKPKRKR
jgi:hypothetical protein